MSISTALAQLVAIMEGVPVADGPAFRHDPTHQSRVQRRFHVALLGGAQVVPTNEGRYVTDVDIVWHYEAQKTPSANRHQRQIDIDADVKAAQGQLLNTSTWNRPASGIKRITVPGREAMSYRYEDDDEGNTRVRVSFPMEHT